MQDPYGYPEENRQDDQAPARWEGENHELYTDPIDLEQAPQDGPAYDQDLEELSPEEEEERLSDRKKLRHGASVVLGIALILVCSALIVGLISWLQKDFASTMVLLQSGLQ